MLVAGPSNSKRQATTSLFDQETPTKVRKTEAQKTPVTPGSKDPNSVLGRVSSFSDVHCRRSESPCPRRDTQAAGDQENVDRGAADAL